MGGVVALRLDSPAQTLALASFGGRLPAVVHWGAPLPAGEDLAALALAAPPPRGKAMLDAPAEISLCPEDGWAFPGHPGLLGSGADGRRWQTQFRLERFAVEAGLLRVVARDAAASLRYEAALSLDAATDMLVATARLTNEGAGDFRLDWLAAPALPAPFLSDGTIEFSGRWTGEFRERRLPWSPGARLRENRLGRTSHEHFPGLIALGAGAGETGGEVWWWHLGWSGGHRMVAEELPDGRRLVQFGATLRPGEIILGPGESWETPPLSATYSAAGLNGAMWAAHRHVRRIVAFPDPARPRPVHYNCWEAVYFDHDLPALREIASRAAALGAERFVLDDGWFRGRGDDAAGLGDWEVDAGKFPDGLAPLIGHVRAEGMEFGLWVEPEMVNEDSDFFRAHPDWGLAVAGHERIAGRGQFVLDLGREDVREHLFAALDALLSAHPIDYLKWDHNRNLASPGGADGRAGVAAQTAGVHALIDRLRAAHPAVEIESCASGGARIDYGMLARTHRVWLSDSNDALERWRMQRSAALFLPPEVVGAHVGPRRCHTSGRLLPMAFRAGVAATRHMGVELDPRELTADEAATLAAAIEAHKRRRGLLASGRLHLLASADAEVSAEMAVSADGGEFLMHVGVTAQLARQAPAPIRLAGLEPGATYALRLDPADWRDGPNAGWTSPLGSGALRLSGAALMRAGLRLPNAHPATLWAIEGRRVAA